MKLSQMLDLSNKIPKNKTVDQHRNISVILGILADKLPGPSSIALLTKDTLTYLFNNMVINKIQYVSLNLWWSNFFNTFCINLIFQDLQIHPSIILFSLIALEKFAQISKFIYLLYTCVYKCD